MKILKSLAIGGFAAGLTLAAGVGQAQAQPAPRTIAVPYGDLDLGSSAGRAALDRRLDQAIREACGAASSADLAGQNRTAACRRDLQASLAGRLEAAFAAGRLGRSDTVLAGRR